VSEDPPVPQDTRIDGNRSEKQGDAAVPDLVLRMVDDYLIITSSRDTAVAVLSRLIEGRHDDTSLDMEMPFLFLFHNDLARA
jgi:hypothetical protein